MALARHVDPLAENPAGHEVEVIGVAGAEHPKNPAEYPDGQVLCADNVDVQVVPERVQRMGHLYSWVVEVPAQQLVESAPREQNVQ